MKNSNFPLVSICIPTFNGAKFIAEAMQSAIDQDYPNLEIIISDDASKDDTLTITENFKKQTAIPIKIYPHKPNGIGSNWNYSITKAAGEYIKFLFQDDVLMPNCISSMVEVMENNPKLGMVASKREFLIEDTFLNETIKKWIEKFSDLQRGLNFKSENNIQIIDHTLFCSNQFLRSPLNKIGEPCVIMFKKGILEKIGYYREDLKQILDYEFCYRLLKTQPIAIINENLVKFRLHQNQATNVNRHSGTDDYKKYNKILLREYFWYLNTNTRIRLLKKEYKWINFLFKLKSKLKLNGK
ncbi:glycosyltransferase family 2 protein [Winogradskyella costae]|jgi:glycosyltransferase involved in cell wall biosynthesis|uniref:glycosyltransferase family 2 protein n=1 Tax=Winogradskyella costae TaxID=2697008 RepID=UPI0015CAE805|nr:glycosyltransferase [Winogradskyella costae]